MTGVPTKDYRLPSEWIQENTTVVNVASYKNVDEESLLMVPGVVYVPMVGKVTVAMLERNLMRLFDQFHHPDRKYKQFLAAEVLPWYGHPLNLYTAITVTFILAHQVLARK